MPEAPPTAYPSTSLKEQNQEGGKGLDAKLEPGANWTQLEFWDDEGSSPSLKDYEGRGLLKDKAVLITGGDSGMSTTSICIPSFGLATNCQMRLCNRPSCLSKNGI
jgi:hypothetical protein